MRFRLALLVTVTSVLTVASPAHAGPLTTTRPASAASEWRTVHQMLFVVTLPDFLAVADRGGDPRLDWSTDYCSAPLVGNTGWSFDFHGPCRRHDFGYRNLRLLERRYGTGGTYWNSTNRKRVDDRFYADMLNHCATRAWWLRASCRNWARTFYLAVRVAGGP